MSAEEDEPWRRVEVIVSSNVKEGSLALEKRRFMVPLAILTREGEQSYFAAHLRFAPDKPIDLGRLECSTRLALEHYLMGGTIGEDDVDALQYVADVFGMARLAGSLAHITLVKNGVGLLQCLNCRVHITEALRGTPCSFKPPRVPAVAGTSCSVCGRRYHCMCTVQLPSHVLLGDAARERTDVLAKPA